ncbi:hypothetical protein ERJ75_001343400 [Trypanosoma vivax]|uniref:Transmembrane protein n=1 Tax=Trypanosoma vivax (strain Y486) TaxID=1055687 RepID=G0U5X1_TRYVY|nr:hypothetical protein TRVL_01571 [Trypanosoma vivax]KAH8607904.1 hypothetical protein ERJ75_001343400 [Trypanosoma vivax]CCC51272.1 conserved hypothetical protein, fragment [Trypanosoma vivax Y486]
MRATGRLTACPEPPSLTSTSGCTAYGATSRFASAPHVRGHCQALKRGKWDLSQLFRHGFENRRFVSVASMFYPKPRLSFVFGSTCMKRGASAGAESFFSNIKRPASSRSLQRVCSVKVDRSTGPGADGEPGSLLRERCGYTNDGGGDAHACPQGSDEPFQPTIHGDPERFPADTLTSSDARRYAFAFELWRHRNAQLIQIQREMQKLSSDAHHLHSMHENRQKEIIRHARRFAFTVVCPWLLLVYLFLSTGNILYRAELEGTRLCDYDAWRRERGRKW